MNLLCENLGAAAVRNYAKVTWFERLLQAKVQTNSPNRKGIEKYGNTVTKVTVRPTSLPILTDAEASSDVGLAMSNVDTFRHRTEIPSTQFVFMRIERTPLCATRWV